MKITQKEKYSHIRWLGNNVGRYGTNAIIKFSQKPDCLSITLEPQPFGRKEPFSPPICKLKLKGHGRIRRPLYWQFRERWQFFTGHKKGGYQYEFCRLDIILLDEQWSELLLFHWTIPSPKSEPYQPHWHVKWNTGGYSVSKIHFPLSDSWKAYCPQDIKEYHDWLKGLLAFFDSEFPRCF